MCVITNDITLTSQATFNGLVKMWVNKREKYSDTGGFVRTLCKSHKLSKVPPAACIKASVSLTTLLPTKENSMRVNCRNNSQANLFSPL